MMNNKFYQLNHSGHSTYSFVSSDLSFEGFETTICSACKRIISSFVYNDTEHKFVICKGKRFPDLMQCCNLGDIPLLFSERTVQVFSENGVTGFDVVGAVKLFSERSYKHTEITADCPTYYEIKVTGSINYDFSAMFLKKKKVCNVCNQFNLNRQRLSPIFIDFNSWDGSDICELSLFPRQRYCTEKVLQIAKKNKLTGFDFEAVRVASADLQN